jgi:hypothetical protein
MFRPYLQLFLAGSIFISEEKEKEPGLFTFTVRYSIMVCPVLCVPYMPPLCGIFCAGDVLCILCTMRAILLGEACTPCTKHGVVYAVFCGVGGGGGGGLGVICLTTGTAPFLSAA